MFSDVSNQNRKAAMTPQPSPSYKKNLKHCNIGQQGFGIRCESLVVVHLQKDFMLGRSLELWQISRDAPRLPLVMIPSLYYYSLLLLLLSKRNRGPHQVLLHKCLLPCQGLRNGKPGEPRPLRSSLFRRSTYHTCVTVWICTKYEM